MAMSSGRKNHPAPFKAPSFPNLPNLPKRPPALARLVGLLRSEIWSS
ncbi:hypothetical protein D104_09305 [Marinomonas profundimaris]|uniref:Uncharacterized protein n=1 Tax=Marinomonas profundimaris TaxID=1208321 RepID=W1RT43_9GAMM|nr:hypothetical protein D104_09305 [Marinomonas profundimaris]